MLMMEIIIPNVALLALGRSGEVPGSMSQDLHLRLHRQPT